ncbi:MULTISPECIES: SRPBCC family protein [unclassified Mucilaginibacter]|uniref:type II toxin-antitoxin system RatA family toxin n=1 Tax=unclassified Mucilaginibacter TaxID=2617802 RepID=UPI002AC8A6A5|nr:MULTISPECIES: SRPBCC family protein [unclassified Mucilaginibacter]MEB0262471.1 SRPBCC family protein [Mucilaginibacter sp. 10I4]MEB0279911.1 SRPBCC family protein [Mucilaginibacter sp. 10B2]MEB0300057.1 SRPBCC family protein [Mucilaginibacter sp. 5C4]WPX21869.1 SRPBCC family protein [Mucilaginibacter sp. 5C4]
MKNIKFTESIIINTSQQVAFDFTQDYDTRLRWDTFLKKAELINGATEAGVGVKAWCVAKNGLGMETEYVSFNPPKATAIKMTKGPYIFSAFLGSWTFKEITPAQTEVIFLYSFSLRFPFNLFTSIIKRNLQNNVKQRLLDLKKNLEV